MSFESNLAFFKTLTPPKVYANAFHIDPRLYTLLMIDPGPFDQCAFKYSNLSFILQMFPMNQIRVTKPTSTGSSEVFVDLPNAITLNRHKKDPTSRSRL
jgi:hypothetical protein